MGMRNSNMAIMYDFSTQVKTIRQSVTDEVLRVAGISSRGFLRKLLNPLIWPPANKFAKLIAELDRDVATIGYRKATRNLVQRFVQELQIIGQENVPQKGPLLVVSNHPGTLDGFAIMSTIPRDDMKVVVEGFTFLRSMTASSEHMIYTPQDSSGRIGVVRSIIRHLSDGGGILVFPSGQLDPDPDVFPGASEAFDRWSPSLEFILNKVPETQVMISIISGLIAQSCANNPITRFWDELWMKIRVAEFIQMLQQTFISKDFSLIPRISYGDPLTIDDLLKQVDSSSIIEEIINRARKLLSYHIDNKTPPVNSGEIYGST